MEGSGSKMRIAGVLCEDADESDDEKVERIVDVERPFHDFVESGIWAALTVVEC